MATILFSGEWVKLKSREVLFRNYLAKTTTMIVLCSVQNLKVTWRLKLMLWTNEVSRDLILRQVSEGYLMLQQMSNQAGRAH